MALKLEIMQLVKNAKGKFASVPAIQPAICQFVRRASGRRLSAINPGSHTPKLQPGH